jgi:hypothetical protein
MGLRIRKVSCVGFTRARIFPSLKMVTTRSSETSVLTRSTHCHIPEDGILNKSILQVRLHGIISQEAELFGTVPFKPIYIYVSAGWVRLHGVATSHDSASLSPGSLDNIIRCRESTDVVPSICWSRLQVQRSCFQFLIMSNYMFTRRTLPLWLCTLLQAE